MAMYNIQAQNSRAAASEASCRRHVRVHHTSRRVMKLSCSSQIILAVVGLLTFGIGSVSALDLTGCSSLNTGASFKKYHDTYMSNGFCHDKCNPLNYAFAITQGFDCWCSNYAPASTTDIGDCADICPGYPYEYCGSTKNNLFGYISLLRAPSGTVGGSDSTRRPIQSPSAVTVVQTVTASASVVSSSNTATSSTSSSLSLTPFVTVQTVTGIVQTVTIIPTQPPGSSSAPVTGKPGFFSNAGKAAGLFVGLAFIVILAVAGALFFCWRRRHRNDQMLAPAMARTNSSPLPQSRSRSISELGLMDGGLMGEKQTLPRITTGLWAMNGGSNNSPVNGTPANKRDSVTRVVDQRLDPGTVWSANHDNSSRISVRSLQDDRDYSRRVLRLANPDG